MTIRVSLGTHCTDSACKKSRYLASCTIAQRTNAQTMLEEVSLAQELKTISSLGPSWMGLAPSPGQPPPPAAEEEAPL